MAVFESKEKMYAVLGGLFEELFQDPSVVAALGKAGVTTRYQLSDPQGEVWLTSDGRVLYGPQSETATVTMILSGDTCHRFWMKKLSLPLALAKGKVKAKGPLHKTLKLMPLLKPAFERYPEFARSHGITADA